MSGTTVVRTIDTGALVLRVAPEWCRVTGVALALRVVPEWCRVTGVVALALRVVPEWCRVAGVVDVAELSVIGD